MQSAMLHDAWPLTKLNLQCRQICSIKLEDVATIRSRKLLAKLELENQPHFEREVMYMWSDLAVQSEQQVDGRCRPGRPKIFEDNVEEID